jgi:hypothetical protein
MRTTLDLDPDVLEAARRLAAADSKSIGQIISELARRSLEVRMHTRRVQGVPVFAVPPDARPFSLEDIKREDPEW